MTDGRVRNADLWRHRTLRVLLLATLADNVGTWAFTTVFTLVVFERTHSPAWIGVALACRWVPGLLVGPAAGVIADRYDRSRVMIFSAAGGAALMAVLAVGVAVDLPLGVLLVISAAQVLFVAVYNPAFGATLPDVVPERLLAPANAMREVVNNVAVIGGPAVGSLFLLAGDPALGIAFNAVTYLVPVAVLPGLKIRSRGSGAAGVSPLTEFREGFTALLEQHTAVLLIIALSLDSAVAGLCTALALPISRHVGTGSAHYGYLLIGLSLGSVLAAGVSGRLAARRRLATVITVALVGQAVPLALIVVVPQPAAAFVLLAVSGAGMIVVDLVSITALQRDVPAAYLGRILAMADTVLLAFVAGFATLGGLFVDWVGVAPMLLVVGVAVPIAALAFLPFLREADRRAEVRLAAIEPVVALLEQLDLFDGADRPVLERLAVAAVPTPFAAGEVLLREGEPAEDVWLIAEGELAVESSAGGDLPRVSAPAYVGEIGVLHERPRTATVIAMTGCRTYRLAGRDFREALNGRAASSSLLLLSGERLSRTSDQPVAVA